MFGIREESVFLTDLLATLGDGQDRHGRYRVRAVVLEGRRYEKSLVTEVRNRPGEAGATLAIPLDGRFRNFRATVGRDPSETAGGPACVYFEVWGDDRRLFLSQALRSPAHLVKVAPGAGGKVRRIPQEVSVEVRGIRELRLVTRYADDFAQQAPQVDQGRGCVWGDPRLERDAAPERAVPAERIVPGERPAPTVREAPLRDALRGPALRLAVAVAGTLPPETRLPMSLAVAPLRLEGMALAGPSEPGVRAILTELLAGARRGGDALFTPVGRREGERIGRDVPARRPERPEAEEIRAVTEAARRVNAEVVLTGTYLPATRDEPGRLTLTLLDVRSGAKRGATAAVLPVAEAGK